METLLLIVIVAGFVFLVAPPRIRRSFWGLSRRGSRSRNNYIYPGSSSSSDYGSYGGDYGSSNSDCGGSTGSDGSSSCGDGGGGGGAASGG